MTPDASTLAKLAKIPRGDRDVLIVALARRHGIPPSEVKQLMLAEWRVVGRAKQQPPRGDDWAFWLILAGRGFGKTLTGAQWTKERSETHPGCRVALVGPTLGDVRETMVEGETGLLSILPDSALRGGSRSSAWNRSTVELYLANGTLLRGFSSETPDRLRGPQHHFAWGDELSSWKDARKGDALETTWSNLKLGTRLGAVPQFCLTTTPKPNKLTKAVLGIPDVRLVKGSSYENRDNLSEAWWRTVVAPLEGTRTGKQEIEAELLEDVEGALWTSAQLEALRVDAAPAMSRLVVAVDPNVSSDEAANDAGVIVAGLGASDRYGYVLADRTITRGGPRAWARAAVDAYHEYAADVIVAEKNNGGEMVKITIETVDPHVHVRLVSASRGKRTRAEPVASLYEGDPELGNPPRVRHVGPFDELEEQMTTWTPDAESPDRMDALVWGLTELMLGGGTGEWKSSLPPKSARIGLPSERRSLVR